MLPYIQKEYEIEKNESSTDWFYGLKSDQCVIVSCRQNAIVFLIMKIEMNAQFHEKVIMHYTIHDNDGDNGDDIDDVYN